MTDDYDFDIEELRQEVVAEKRYYNQLIRHPLSPYTHLTLPTNREV